MFYTGLPTDCVLYILHLARYDWFEPPESETQETTAPDEMKVCLGLWEACLRFLSKH